MPRKTKAEQQIISNKIRRLTGEGYKKKQATAIALRMFRDGEIPRPVKKPRAPNTLRSQTRQRTNIGNRSRFRNGK